MYAIYDSQAKTFGQPFVAANNDVAMRACTDLVTPQHGRPHTDHVLHPEQFMLFVIGEYDTESGHLHEYDDERHMCVVKFVELVPVATENLNKVLEELDRKSVV